MNHVTVLSLISQADRLAGHEVCAPVVNDAAVNSGQLVPVLSGGEVRMEPTRSDRSEKKITWRRFERLRYCHRYHHLGQRMCEYMGQRRRLWSQDQQINRKARETQDLRETMEATTRERKNMVGGGKECVEAKNERTG